MSKILLTELAPGDRALVVMGNFHSRTKEEKNAKGFLDAGEMHTPAGMHVQAARPTTVFLSLRFHTGSRFGFGATFEPEVTALETQSKVLIETPTIESLENGGIAITQAVASPATVYVPEKR